MPAEQGNVSRPQGSWYREESPANPRHEGRQVTSQAVEPLSGSQLSGGLCVAAWASRRLTDHEVVGATYISSASATHSFSLFPQIFLSSDHLRPIIVAGNLLSACYEQGKVWRLTESRYIPE